MRRLLMISVALAAFGAPAFAADLKSRPPAPTAPVVLVPMFTWSGFYVGMQAGYAWGKFSGISTALGVMESANRNGALGGVHAGYNVQSGNMVVGVEGDLEASSRPTTNSWDPIVPGLMSRTRTNAQGSVRGRLGYSFDHTMLFVTGGLAIANMSTRLFDGVAIDEKISSNRAGWTLGGGVEYAVSDNWSAKVGYRYTDFGSTSLNFNSLAGADYSNKTSEHSVRVGVSYRLGGAPSSAISARY